MDDRKKKLIGLVERLGLFETLKLTDMSYVKLWSLIGDSWLTTDIIINFIKDLLSTYVPGGLTIYDISESTITYSETSDGVKEIDYLTPTIVYVVEFNIIGDMLGHIKKTYEELSQDVLFEIFDLLTIYHDDRKNIKLQEQISRIQSMMGVIKEDLDIMGRRISINDDGTLKVPTTEKNFVNVRLTTTLGDINVSKMTIENDKICITGKKGGRTECVDKNIVKDIFNFVDTGSPKEIDSGSWSKPNIKLLKV